MAQMLTTIKDVTQRKFGKAGVDAIARYPELQTAAIDYDHYMKEEGTARPAKTFSFHRFLDDKVVAENRSLTKKTYSGQTGELLYQPGYFPAPQSPPPVAAMMYPPQPKSPPVMLYVGVGIVVLLVGLWWANKPDPVRTYLPDYNKRRKKRKKS